MRIILFSIFGYNVHSHGVFLTLSIIISSYLLFLYAKKEGLNIKFFLSNIIISTLVGVFAARVLFYFLNLKFYTSFYQIIEIWQGGLVSFSGFILGGLTFVFLLTKQKEKIAKWIDLAGIFFPLGIAIGRIGCVLTGETGVRYYGVFAYQNHFPVTALEIYLCLAIFIINFILYLRAKKYLINYFLFFNFVVLYSFFRIFIDKYRADDLLIIGINASQLTSFLIFFLSSLVFSVYYLRHTKKSMGV
jgi:phosphatidylglycerol:prolipoprotein diacylglycerol transferase